MLNLGYDRYYHYFLFIHGVLFTNLSSLINFIIDGFYFFLKEGIGKI